MALPDQTFRVPPPEEPRKPWSPWLILGLGAVAFAAVAMVGVPIAKRMMAARDKGRVMAELGADKNDLYTRTRAEYRENPARFQTKAAYDMGNALRQNAPQGTFTVGSEAAIDDSGPALEMTVEYHASVPAEDGHPMALHGHYRQYVHPYGLVTLDSACYTDFSMCIRYDELVGRAERAIAAHVGEGDLENIVPEDGSCEKKRKGGSIDVHFVAVCTYDDVTLTFERLGLGAANMEMMRRAFDPGDRPAPRQPTEP